MINWSGRNRKRLFGICKKKNSKQTNKIINNVMNGFENTLVIEFKLGAVMAGGIDV